MDGVVALPHVLVYILMAACGVIIPKIGKTIPDIYILKKVLEIGNLQLFIRVDGDVGTDNEGRKHYLCTHKVWGRDEDKLRSLIEMVHSK